MRVSVDDWQFAVTLLAALLTLRLCMLLIEHAYRWAAQKSAHVQAASVKDYFDDLLDLVAVLLLGFGGILAEGIAGAGAVGRTLLSDQIAVSGTPVPTLIAGDAGWAARRLVVLAFILPFIFLRVGWDLGRLRRGWALWPLFPREREVNRALALTFVALFALTCLPPVGQTLLSVSSPAATFHLQLLTAPAAWVVLALRICWVPIFRALAGGRSDTLVRPTLVRPTGDRREPYPPVDEDESPSVFLAGFCGLLFLLGMAPWVTSDRMRLLFTFAAVVIYIPHVIWLAFHSIPKTVEPLPALEVLDSVGQTLLSVSSVEEGVEAVADEPAVLVVAPMDREAELSDEQTGNNACPTDAKAVGRTLLSDDETDKSVCPTDDETDKSVCPTDDETDKSVCPTDEGGAFTEEAPAETVGRTLLSDQITGEGDVAAGETPSGEASPPQIPFHNPYHLWTELMDSAIVAVFLVFVVIRPFLLQAFFIPSESMVPTLQIGDKLLATKATYWIHPPRRGDICVFRAPDLAVSTSGMPQDTEHPLEYVKRVIGLPGEHLRIVAGDGVYINGVKLNEPYIRTPDKVVNYNFPLQPDGSLSGEISYVPELRQNMEQYIVGDEIVIPPGMIFMMGDNRNTSHDSHKWGPLPESAVLGQAFFIFWPPQRVGIVH